MRTKTFKIGEYCKGGIITVNISGQDITIIGKHWDFKAGSNKNSNQSNAKEWTRFESTQDTDRRDILEFLEDLTSSYYAEQIMNWIEGKLH